MPSVAHTCSHCMRSPLATLSPKSCALHWVWPRDRLWRLLRSMLVGAGGVGSVLLMRTLGLLLLNLGLMAFVLARVLRRSCLKVLFLVRRLRLSLKSRPKL